MSQEQLVSGLIYYVVFLFSTTVHEAAHAWAAKLGGDLTAYHGGQVSLDPRPHIQREPFGMVILPLISTLTTGWPFGYASAPYDPQWAMRHPKRHAWMALAGPASNLTLVSGDLRAAVDAIRLARRTLRTIKGNLFWAFAYNVAAIPLAISGLLNPIIAVAVKYTGFAYQPILTPPSTLSSQKPGMMPMIVSGIEIIRTSGMV